MAKASLNRYFQISPLIVIILFFILPVFISSQYILHLFVLAFLYSVLAMNFDLAYGYLGLINFGYASLFGVGAYTSALLSMHLRISPWLSIFVGGALAVLICIPIGFACLRVRGHYLAIVTLGLGEILRIIYSRALEPWTLGMSGLWGIPPFPNIQIPFLGTIDFSGVDRVPYYYLTLTILLVITLMEYKLVKSKVGIMFRSIREDEEAAKSLGIDTVRYKLMGFVISGFFAGMMGGVYAHYLVVLIPDLLGIGKTVEILTMTLIGGAGTLFGPIIGAFILIYVSEFLRFLAGLRFIVFGIFIVLVVIFWPKGVIGIPDYLRSLSEKTSKKEKR
ncbi:MAG: branched-chain amino acid ABC transporter permease [Candidatus Geothermarchaeales archaeon]